MPPLRSRIAVTSVRKADPDRAARSMEAVHDRLVSPADGLIALFTPPFDRAAINPGYVAGYWMRDMRPLLPPMRIAAFTVANCGSVGLPYDGDWRPSYALIDDGRAVTIRRVEFDRDAEARAIRQSGFPLAEWLIKVQHRGRFTRPT